MSRCSNEGEIIDFLPPSVAPTQQKSSTFCNILINDYNLPQQQQQQQPKIINDNNNDNEDCICSSSAALVAVVTSSCSQKQEQQHGDDDDDTSTTTTTTTTTAIATASSGVLPNDAQSQAHLNHQHCHDNCQSSLFSDFSQKSNHQAFNTTCKNSSVLSLSSTGIELPVDEGHRYDCAGLSLNAGIHTETDLQRPDHQMYSSAEDVESGRFTEQESYTMDITNEFAINDDDHERTSESDIVEHLRTELDRAKKELRAKNEKCEKLSEMQNIVDAEIHELTASLFQEAYKMVADANEKRHVAEKLYKEANLKVEVLEAEVDALKTLVLTSTPSAPNPHLHPQISILKKPPLGISKSFFGKNNSNGGNSSRTARSSLFNINNNNNNNSGNSNSLIFGHKRNLSDSASSLCASNFVQNRNNSFFDQRQQQRGTDSAAIYQTSFSNPVNGHETMEIDPNYFREYTSWREILDPKNKSHPFLKRIYDEEILPCMNFTNVDLAKEILDAIEKNTVIVERSNDDNPTVRTCPLLKIPCTCVYSLKLDNHSEPMYISLLSRNRIATICDFLTYLRYMQQGLVKSCIRNSYWEVIRLRKNMTLARLGLDIGN